jgi:hypothetical protein
MGKRKSTSGKNARLHERLQRIKGIRHLRSGIRGAMASPVHERKEPWQMHESVGPIEICVMSKDGEHDARKKPHPAVGAYFEINVSPVIAQGKLGHHTDNSINATCQSGKSNLTADDSEVGRVFDDLAVKPVFAAKHVKEQPHHARSQNKAKPFHRGHGTHSLQKNEEFRR